MDVFRCRQYQSDYGKLSAGVEVNDSSTYTRNTTVQNSSNRDEVAKTERHYSNIIVECEVLDQSSTDGDFIEDYSRNIAKEMKTTEKLSLLRKYRSNSVHDQKSLADDSAFIAADISGAEGPRSQLLSRKLLKLAAVSPKDDVTTNYAGNTTDKHAIGNGHICALHTNNSELYSQSFDEFDGQNQPTRVTVARVDSMSIDGHRICRSDNVRRGAIKKKNVFSREHYWRELQI